MADEAGERPVAANMQYGGEYREKLEESARTGKCIFCEPRFHEGEKVLLSCHGWSVVRNEYPTKDREGNDPALHLLFVKDSHEDELIPNRDWLAIGLLAGWAEREFKLKGYGVAIRIGHPRWSGRTILHPHAQFVVPNVVEDPVTHEKKAIPVDFPIG